VEPLAPQITAPAQLAARLAWVGVVARADGPALAKGLPVGARLVSKEGDLWRWDGFVARADAPKPAAVRLAQRTRLSEVEEEIDGLKPAADAAQKALKDAADRVRAAEDALREARKRPPEAERTVATERDLVDRLSREQARKEARAQALDETVARLEADLAEARKAAETARAEGGAGTDLNALRAELG
ncbi:chromosome segregation protein SMC, partial [Caulobacter sp. 17J65-9]|nr:chromosome segregation protein SMC [Caulobacter sp. 17J65-9]